MSYKLISFIVPAYNEEKTIAEILRRLSLLNLGIKKEIIVIDDGSDDDTKKIVKGVQKNSPEIKLIVHKENCGKGKVIKTGFKEAKGDIITIQDADLEYDVKDFKKLFRPILEKKAKVVYGSRFLKRNNEGRKLFYFGNKFLSLVTSILYGVKITDMETCYKIFDKKVVKDIKIESRGFDIEPEITSKILRKGYKIIEIPIDYFPRSKEEGKKIKVSDGFKALWTLIKYRFN